MIDNQTSVTVNGGTGRTFGSWTGGTITIGAGNLTFAGGNTALGDNISVNGGKGTVFNNDALRIAAPQTIAGNFDQFGSGLLDFGLAGDMKAQYGALDITGAATLAGGLGIDLTGGFKLATGDTFDILGFGSLAGPGFDALALDGAACSSTVVDKWTCGGGVHLNEVIDATSLDLVVAHASAAFGPAGVAHPRTIDLGDARFGLPRPRRPRAAQTQEGGRNRATVTLSPAPFPPMSPTAPPGRRGDSFGLDRNAAADANDGQGKLAERMEPTRIERGPYPFRHDSREMTYSRGPAKAPA